MRGIASGEENVVARATCFTTMQGSLVALDPTTCKDCMSPDYKSGKHAW